jgi:hypothetical protein
MGRDREVRGQQTCECRRVNVMAVSGWFEASRSRMGYRNSRCTRTLQQLHLSLSHTHAPRSIGRLEGCWHGESHANRCEWVVEGAGAGSWLLECGVMYKIYTRAQIVPFCRTLPQRLYQLDAIQRPKTMEMPRPSKKPPKPPPPPPKGSSHPTSPTSLAYYEFFTPIF